MAPGQGTEGDGKKMSGMLAFRSLLGESRAFNPVARPSARLGGKGEPTAWKECWKQEGLRMAASK